MKNFFVTLTHGLCRSFETRQCDSKLKAGGTPLNIHGGEFEKAMKRNIEFRKQQAKQQARQEHQAFILGTLSGAVIMALFVVCYII